MKLDRSQKHTWTDLVKTFLAQYDHVVDNASDRMALMIMEKKATKNFKDTLISGEILLRKSNLH